MLCSTESGFECFFFFFLIQPCPLLVNICNFTAFSCAFLKGFFSFHYSPSQFHIFLLISFPLQRLSIFSPQGILRVPLMASLGLLLWLVVEETEQYSGYNEAIGLCVK